MPAIPDQMRYTAPPTSALSLPRWAGDRSSEATKVRLGRYGWAATAGPLRLGR